VSTASPLPAAPAPTVTPAAPAVVTSPAPIDDDTNARLVKQAEEVELFYSDQLRETFDGWVRFQRLYTNSFKDTRKDHEKWRAAIKVPRPFMLVEAKTAQMVEILTGADPMVQATAVGEDDRERAKAAERAVDYILYGNAFRKLLTATCRSMSVGGTDWWTSRYAKQSFTINTNPTTQDEDYFQKSIQEAVAAGIPAPPDPRGDATSAEAFEMWRGDVNKTTKLRIPAVPKAGPQEIVTYEGPIIDRVPFTEMRFDPMVQEVRNQPFVIRKMVRSERWVNRLVEKGLFDKARVDLAMSGWDGEKADEFRQQEAALLGYTVGSVQDPLMKLGVDVWIVYAQENREFPYQVILNRKQVVNTRPDQLPYAHGQCEFLALRNILIPGYQAGMSDLKQPEGLFTEINSLRNLRLDGVHLSVLPAMVKSPEMGMTELMRNIAPGVVLNARNANSIKKLIDSLVPQVAFTEMASLYEEVDEATGITGAVRGAAATVNRVSASEATGRFQQALLRPKLNALMVEEDMNPGIVHWLSHLHQFGTADLRVKMTGLPGDPWAVLRKQDLLDAMRYDLRFGGATQTRNREIAAQQLTAFVEKFAAYLMPVEIRAAAKDIYEMTGMKGVSEVITEAGTAKMQQAWELQQAAMLQQTQQAQAQAQAQAQGAPAAVEGAQAQAVQNAGSAAA
jgi:hypothetical protein